MRLRHLVKTCAASAAFLLSAAAAAPAMADDGGVPGATPPGADMRPQWKESRDRPTHAGMDARGRDEWLSECRRRLSRRDDGLGGALIGGVLGGVAGNRIAGRGNRMVGTAAGAAIGAVAGAVIDKAEDSSRSRDECETYFDSYYEYYDSYARTNPGYGYAYVPAQGQACFQQPMMMVPVYMVPRKGPESRETVEYVDEPE